MHPLLEVGELVVRYRRRRRTITAVGGVSLVAWSGETVGVVGESGSGKSTLARAIVGLAPVASGRVTFRGADVTYLPFGRRRELYRELQLVFQDPYSSLNPARTIGQTLTEPLVALERQDPRDARRRVRELLERVELSGDAMDRYPAEFSGGQRQRIAIVRALVLSPRLVILDEPVSALDLSVQAQILNLLRRLQSESNLSYLLISHDLDVVRHMCDRVVVLYRGKVVEAGTTADVIHSPADDYTAALLAAAPLPDPGLQRARHA